MKNNDEKLDETSRPFENRQVIVKLLAKESCCVKPTLVAYQ